MIDQAVQDAAERLRPGDLRQRQRARSRTSGATTSSIGRWRRWRRTRCRPSSSRSSCSRTSWPTPVDGPIERLIAAGVQFVVDDFGTGYSALAYLKRLPVASVKIDRSFVVGITDDPVDASIVRAIVEACRATGRTCVAEGVERASQALLLAELGVDTLQGELLGRAAPLATYAEIIEAGPPGPGAHPGRGLGTEGGPKARRVLESRHGAGVRTRGIA